MRRHKLKKKLANKKYRVPLILIHGKNIIKPCRNTYSFLILKRMITSVLVTVIMNPLPKNAIIQIQQLL